MHTIWGQSGRMRKKQRLKKHVRLKQLRWLGALLDSFSMISCSSGKHWKNCIKLLKKRWRLILKNGWTSPSRVTRSSQSWWNSTRKKLAVMWATALSLELAQNHLPQAMNLALRISKMKLSWTLINLWNTAQMPLPKCNLTRCSILCHLKIQSNKVIRCQKGVWGHSQLAKNLIRAHSRQ